MWTQIGITLGAVLVLVLVVWLVRAVGQGIKFKRLKARLLPEAAPDYAAKALQTATQLGVPLDFSVATLPNVDRCLLSLSERWGTRPASRAVLPFGCYLGEVLVRAFQGKWARIAVRGERVTLVELPVPGSERMLHVDPVAAVLRCWQDRRETVVYQFRSVEYTLREADRRSRASEQRGESGETA